jgi:hypothetical protein
VSHWLDYHMLLVINYFVLTILITPKLVRLHHLPSGRFLVLISVLACIIVPQWTTGIPKVSTHLTALGMYSLQVFHEKKSVVTHFRVNTCGTEGETTLTSFRNTVNTKTRIAVARKAEQLPPISAHLMIAE